MAKFLLGNNTKERAFKKLYLEYYPPMCLYARRFIDDKTVCEDIVTDVFTAMWQNSDKIGLAPGPASAYLKTAIRNGCLNYLRHQQYEVNYAGSLRKKGPDYSTLSDAVFTAGDIFTLLSNILERMPEEYSRVFLMSYFDGKQQEEIARQLNVSLKSVSRYKKKATEIVEKALKDVSH